MRTSRIRSVGAGRLRSSGIDLGADAGLGEDLEQQRVRHAAVEDHGPRRRRRRSAARQVSSLGIMPPVDGAVARSARARLRRPTAPRSAGRRRRARRATSVSSSSLRRPQRAGDRAGRGVGVDVVGLAVVADADRRDHRDDVGALRTRSSTSVRIRDGSPTKPRSSTSSMLAVGVAPGARQLGRLDQAAVLAATGRRALPPAAWIAVTICLLILPASTISTISTVAASVTRRPVDELALDLEPVEHRLDLRPAAVHHDRVDADLLEQHDVAGEVARQRSPSPWRGRRT